MRRLKYLGFVAMAYLSGCYSFPTETLAAVNSAYTGQHVDEFFLAHGLPSKSYELANGDFIYEWISKVKSVYIPASTTTTGHVNSYGGFQAYSTTVGGVTKRRYCTLQIVTSADGLVRRIELTQDTTGGRKASRFAVLFDDYKSENPPEQ